MAASVHHSANMARPAINEHIPDIFTIICCNDSFQLALDHNTIKTLLRVCKRARPLLSSKLPRFYNWCQSMELLNPDGQLRIGLTLSDEIAISLYCDDQATTDRSWLEDQADKGNAAASYFLARILQSKVSRRQTDDSPDWDTIHQQITTLLQTAADNNHPVAQFHLAECYYQCLGVDQDHARAAELYRQAAIQGYPRAQVAFGRCYESGEGVDQSFDSAIEWYSKAADQGSEDGRLHIVFLRAWFSFIGHGVEQSDADAFHHWQEVSTLSTDPVLKLIATHMLGWMHYLGRGTMRNKQKGVKLIRETKSDDFKLGEDECLAAYWNDTKSDSPISRKFFDLCQLGSDRDWLCRYLMAVCVFQGFGTTEDEKKAAGIFEQLAAEGHSDSQLRIGGCYYWGRGVLVDSQKSFEWYSKSADRGNSYGQWWVGVCYSNGYGTAKDVAKAVEWYRRSAEQGNRYGQCWIGFRSEMGYGVPENVDTAAFWYRKSANQGYDWAMDSLKDIDQWP